MQQRRARRGATGPLAAAPTLRSLREGAVIGLSTFSSRSATRAGENASRAEGPRQDAPRRARRRALHPGARLTVESSDLSCIDKRFGLGRR